MRDVTTSVDEKMASQDFSPRDRDRRGYRLATRMYRVMLIHKEATELKVAFLGDGPEVGSRKLVGISDDQSARKDELKGVN